MSGSGTLVCEILSGSGLQSTSVVLKTVNNMCSNMSC